jgi:hypothetical protein
MASGVSGAYGLGGGVRNLGTLTAKNTIIALNSSGTAPDFSGTLTSQGFNLIGNNTGATITPAQSSDQIGTAGVPINPLLGQLASNGGPTQTHALLAGSRATKQRPLKRLDYGSTRLAPTH